MPVAPVRTVGRVILLTLGASYLLTFFLPREAKSWQRFCYLFWRELARILVVGRKEAVRVYEPLSYTGTDPPEEYHSFHRGLGLFYAGKCKQAYEEFVKTADRDSVARFYTLECQKLRENMPENWDGVLRLESK